MGDWSPGRWGWGAQRGEWALQGRVRHRSGVGGGLGEGGRWPLLAACMEGVLEEGRSLRWPRNDKRNLSNGNGSWGGRGLGYPENMKEGPF